MAFIPDPQHPLPPEYPTWLDYSTIYIAHGQDARDQLKAIREVIALAKEMRAGADVGERFDAAVKFLEDEVNFK